MNSADMNRFFCFLKSWKEGLDFVFEKLYLVEKTVFQRIPKFF